MASEVEVSRLRRMTDVSSSDLVYTSDLLSNLIDEIGFEQAASSIWKEKAAGYASLVDTSESGSSRSLSQLSKQALDMATKVAPQNEPSGGSFTVGIERV